MCFRQMHRCLWDAVRKCNTVLLVSCKNFLSKQHIECKQELPLSISILVPVVMMTPDHEEVPIFGETYELAAPADENAERSSPGPYEVAMPINYEDIDLSNTGDVCNRNVVCNPQPYEEYNGQYESIERNSDDEGQPYEQYDSERYEEDSGPLQYEVPALTLAPQPPPQPSKRTHPLPPLPYAPHSSISPPPNKQLSDPPPPKPLPRKKRNIAKTSSGRLKLVC